MPPRLINRLDRVRRRLRLRWYQVASELGLSGVQLWRIRTGVSPFTERHKRLVSLWLELRDTGES